MPDLESLHPALSSGLFCIAAGVVWFAGTYLSRTAELIADHTGVGHAFVGALLLGGATSLPEIATTVTASSLGNAEMATNNLLGGVLLQTAVLAGVDLVLVRGAFTFFAPSAALLLSGVLLCVELSLAIAAMAVGDVTIAFGIGAWPCALASVYIVSLFFLRRFEAASVWVVSSGADLPDDEAGERATRPDSKLIGDHFYVAFAACSIAVLLGGWAVSGLAHTIADQTGLSSGFLGATAVALATSLPEVSATVAAVTRGAYTLAISNIFGSNALMVGLLLVADAAYRPGPIVNEIGEDTVLLTALGITATALYLWGLLERRNKTVLRLGVDSAAVLVVVVGGLALFYLING